MFAWIRGGVFPDLEAKKRTHSECGLILCGRDRVRFWKAPWSLLGLAAGVGSVLLLIQFHRGLRWRASDDRLDAAVLIQVATIGSR